MLGRHLFWRQIRQVRSRPPRRHAAEGGGGQNNHPKGSSWLASSGETSTLTTPQPPSVFPYVLVLPIARRPLFPLAQKTVVVREESVVEAMRALVARGQPYVGAFLTRDDDSEADTIKSIDEIHRIGTLAQITRFDVDNDGALTCTLYPHRRIRIDELVPRSTETPSENQPKSSAAAASNNTATMDVADLLAPFNVSRALTSELQTQPYSVSNPLLKALTSELLATLKTLIQVAPHLRSHLSSLAFLGPANKNGSTSIMDDPALLADFVSSIVPFADPVELQSVLESLVVEERVQKALILLKKEVANAKLQTQIQQEVDDKMAKARQEYYLMELMKGIQKELGMESDGRDKLVAKFRDKAKLLDVPTAVRSVFDEEVQKFKNLDPSAMDFNVTRNYLDWLTQVPWGKRTQESFDLANARAILDEDHYGMQDVKDRILEFIAVGKLKQSVQGKILLLSGPPGVGKTSIGKSIARALGRDFFRFSVGGLNDVSEIKGHRRTYVGAMPGKLVQALKKVQAENPLILIDEIDKMGRSDFRGDPSSALLEVLDPEQNGTFLDHYMDVPIDLSKVLFMCTANTLDTIPGPLLDRMEVIQVAGYVAEEKMAIAKKYLIPDACESAGLNQTEVDINDDALEELMQVYCRESGVRNLKKHVEKIFRKAAFQLVKGDEKVVVTKESLVDFVGTPLFTRDRLYHQTPPGVVMGLAWTGLGGSALYIESLVTGTVKPDQKPSFIQTGQMGDVMKESTSIAYTYASSFLTRHLPTNTFFSSTSVHLHVPEGATPKDGPSAGITMATSLLSLALNRATIADVAMTGELTLTGRVLKIGGVKEKLIAAKRSGVKHIVFPKSNEVDYEALPDFIRDGVKAYFVETYEDVFRIVFPE